jgi:hypothetical protein
MTLENRSLRVQSEPKPIGDIIANSKNNDREINLVKFMYKEINGIITY